MPNYYDTVLAQLLFQQAYPKGTTERQKIGGEWIDVPVSPEYLGPNKRRQQSMQASMREDEMLRDVLSGRGSWNGGRYDFVSPNSRASTSEIDTHRKGKWEQAPRADLMYMHPYSPEKWDDYGPWQAPQGFKMPDRYFRGRRF